MVKEEALIKYKKSSLQKILETYVDADTELIVNEGDSDMEGIAIPLPKPPEWHLITNFGLPRKKQTWLAARPKIPVKLKNLVRKKNKDGNFLSLGEIWDYLEINAEEYQEEIQWIKTQWYHRIYGYWFFLNGKPTYITGKHSYYLTYWYIDIGYPDYRSRDRKYWIFREFCERDTYDFRDKDETGRAISIDGYYHRIDLGRRVCLGMVYPKYRREGATFRSQCDMFETISKLIQASGGTQSMTEEDAQKAFLDKMVKPSKKTPFFFRPETIKIDPKKTMEFDIAVTGKSSLVTTGLESQISYESSDEGAFDGQKLAFFHDDEIGKAKKIDILKRHAITRRCLTQSAGFGIRGFTVKTSTSGEMVSGGGANFQKMIAQSNFYERNKNGQTTSGLYALFISTEDGLFIDEYGNSVIENPEKPVKVFDGKDVQVTSIGAREFLVNGREDLLSKGDLEGWHEFVRQHPMSLAECFLSASNSLGFDIQVLSTRISQLINRNDYWRIGDLIRINPNDKFSPIKFVDNPSGRFKISRVLTPKESNRFYRGPRGWWYPLNGGAFNVGADPYKFGETEGGRMSDGGIAVKMKRDFKLDPDSKNIEEWVSDRYVLTYRYRPEKKKDYTDDVLKVCLYFGCPVLTETNVPQVIDDFTEWGAYPFLKFLRDSQGKLRKTPGMHSGVESKQDLFSGLRDYISRRGLYENHLDLLQEAFEIPDIKKMTHYDLLTAAGLAEVAEKSDYGAFEKEYMEEDVDIGDYVEQYD